FTHTLVLGPEPGEQVKVAITESEFIAMAFPLTVLAMSAAVTAAGAAGGAAAAAAESAFGVSDFAHATSDTAAMNNRALRRDPLGEREVGGASKPGEVRPRQ